MARLYYYHYEVIDTFMNNRGDGRVGQAVGRCASLLIAASACASSASSHFSYKPGYLAKPSFSMMTFSVFMVSSAYCL